MGRRLSTWLVLVRVFQVLGSFIPAAMNGWLLYFIFTNKLGPSDVMFVLEILVRLAYSIVPLSSITSNSSRETCLPGLVPMKGSNDRTGGPHLRLQLAVGLSNTYPEAIKAGTMDH